MKSYSGKDIIKILQKNGWEVDRINGSHHVLINKNKDFIITVPVHGNQSLKIGLVRSILKAANLTKLLMILMQIN